MGDWRNNEEAQKFVDAVHGSDPHNNPGEAVRNQLRSILREHRVSFSSRNVVYASQVEQQHEAIIDAILHEFVPADTARELVEALEEIRKIAGSAAASGMRMGRARQEGLFQRIHGTARQALANYKSQENER